MSKFLIIDVIFTAEEETWEEGSSATFGGQKG
jgi:hypothetical protein